MDFINKIESEDKKNKRNKKNKYYVEKTELEKEPSVHTERLLSKIFRGITQKLNSGMAYEKILDFVFDSLGLVIPFDRIGIALVEKTGEGENQKNQVCLKWVRSRMPIHHLNRKYCAPLGGSSLQKILESGQPRIINNVALYAAEHPQSKSTRLVLKDGIRSSLTCPLRANNKNIGFVFFSSQKENTYEREDIQSFSEIADELSMIIEYGQLKKHFENYMSSAQNIRMTIHDLKSPLSVIQGLLELTAQENWYPHLSLTEKNIFSVMLRNAKYMFDLLNELSELRNQEIEQTSLHVEPVEIDKFCTEIEKTARSLATKKNIDFKIITDQKSRIFHFDPIKIYRVIDNLLTNAFKFSKSNTQVQLKIQCEADRIFFYIIDQGQGIPQSEIPKLFKEFGKTSVRPTSGENSTGLGLAIAKKIVEQHGGEINVVSEVGRGSTFSFWLPFNNNLTTI